MSKYTTTVRNICESYYRNQQEEYPSVAAAIAAGRPHIFAFDYPLFDPDYREELETKILRHYYTREISEETFGLWKLRLEDHLNMTMPYYNQLYRSALISFDPLIDVDYTITHSGTKTGSKADNTSDSVESSGSFSKEGSGTSAETVTNTGENGYTLSGTSSETGTSSRTSGETDLYSDTPQGGIDGLDDSTYLTNARKKDASETGSTSGSGQNSSTYAGTEEGSTETTGETASAESGTNSSTSERTVASSGTSSENDSYTDSIIGRKSGTTPAKLIKEFRETFLNVDKMVIDSLEPYFMQLW